MKYYIIAGEPSGDLHGSNLMKGLRHFDSYAQFRFWGGDLMAGQGGDLVKHYKETAFMGVWDVLMNLGKIRRNFQLCEADLLANRPDVLILIDYPGFNLRLATLPDAMQLTLIELVRRGLLVEPCRNAMAAFHVTDAALPDYVQPVPAGIVRLIELQQAGSAYIRP